MSSKDGTSAGMGRKRMTMAEIARLADVDISTVSRALANSPKVTEKTRQRIREIVEETGYAINHGARMLRHSKSNQILVMLPNIAASFFPEVVLGIEDVAQARGFNVVVGSTRHDPAREEMLSRQLMTGAAEGIILLTGEVPDAVRQFPNFDRHVVAVGRKVVNCHIPQVMIDNHAGMRTAVQHFLDLGHQRIAHLAGPQRSATFEARTQSYRQMMQAAGLERHIDIVVRDRFDIAEGVEAMAELLARPIPPTAVICASDEMAMGAMHATIASGRSVPGDIAFMGFDDIAMSAIFHPTLSTIRLPRQQLGMIGAQLLLANLDVTQPMPDSVIADHNLVVRQSCGGLSR